MHQIPSVIGWVWLPGDHFFSGTDDFPCIGLLEKSPRQRDEGAGNWKSGWYTDHYGESKWNKGKTPSASALGDLTELEEKSQNSAHMTDGILVMNTFYLVMGPERNEYY